LKQASRSKDKDSKDTSPSQSRRESVAADGIGGEKRTVPQKPRPVLPEDVAREGAKVKAREEYVLLSFDEPQRRN
jgi:hypothetical protein